MQIIGYDLATLQAIQAVMDDEMNFITKRKAAGEHVGENALAYRQNIWSLADDCIAELEGEEPSTNNPQAELDDALIAGCHSVFRAIELKKKELAA